METFISYILHLDKTLPQIIASFGNWTYLILFLVLFAETGLVVTPFLPGDSLLFAVGALAGRGELDMGIIFPLLMVAVFLGDNSNYWIGYHLGPKVFSREDVRFLNRKHLERTHAFFEKYGPKAVIFARFVPIVRTCMPFVAGIGRMPYFRFIQFSLVGCVAWLCVCGLGGYYFGQLEIVKKNFSLVIIGIIVVSLIPPVIEYLRHRREEAQDCAGRAGNAA